MSGSLLGSWDIDFLGPLALSPGLRRIHLRVCSDPRRSRRLTLPPEHLPYVSASMSVHHWPVVGGRTNILSRTCGGGSLEINLDTLPDNSVRFATGQSTEAQAPIYLCLQLLVYDHALL